MLKRPAPLARMPHLFHPAGLAALGAALQRRPLLAFDFDGTLAPIAATPEQVRMSQSVSGKLRRLARHLPIAVVTGRSIGDVQGRLADFEPHYIIGNHGAEVGETPQEAIAALDEARHQLAASWSGLARAGVTVEDKGLSLALHYRLSRQPHEAQALIREALRPLAGRFRTFSGKMVENVALADAPDKGTAVHRLVGRCGASCAIFVGDDINDEPMFAAAPADWLTIRVGRDAPGSRARFFLAGTAEVGLMLDRMLTGMEHQAA